MTNPFLKHKVAVARAMCSNYHEDGQQWFRMEESDRREWAAEATAALDALWAAMQADGMVAAERAMSSESGTSTLVYLDKILFPEGTTVLIIRAEPQS